MSRTSAPDWLHKQLDEAYATGYNEGKNDGYKKGYLDGMKDTADKLKGAVSDSFRGGSSEGGEGMNFLKKIKVL